jgi:hypothetical protein
MFGNLCEHRGKLTEAQAEFRRASKIAASLRGAPGKAP